MNEKVKVEIEYWDSESKDIVTETGVKYLKTEPILKSTEIIEDEIENIFKIFYNKTKQHINGSYFKFKDSSLIHEYVKWYNSLNGRTKFHMYYGIGIVD